MCLDVTKKNGSVYKATPVAKTAKKAIVGYKILRQNGRKLEAVVMNFNYEVGKTYTGDLKIYGEPGYDCSWAVEEGFHTYTEKPTRSMVGNDQVIVKCSIPKGAKYYEQFAYDNDGFYTVEQRASDKLRIVKIIE